jgi:formamidopyrimidine-DNA glycosylase
MPEKAEVMITVAQINNLFLPPRSMQLRSVTVKRSHTVCEDEIDYKKTLVPESGFVFGGFVHHGKFIGTTLGLPNTPPIITIILHLGMTGSLKLVEGTPDAELSKSATVEFKLYNLHRKKEYTLLLIDPRTFGRLYFTVKDFNNWVTNHGLATDIMAYEPDKFTANFVKHAQRTPNKPVKEFLLDQSRCAAGIGNYMASEALHAAKLNPLSPIGAIAQSPDKSQILESILNETKAIVQRMAMNHGVTLRDFISPDGKEGTGASLLKVYGRKGCKCVTCKEGVIRRREIAQRATYWCDICQQPFGFEAAKFSSDPEKKLTEVHDIIAKLQALRPKVSAG